MRQHSSWRAHSEMAIKCKLDTYGYYLLAILDKIILVGGSAKPWHTEEGVLIVGLLDFLLNPEIIYQYLHVDGSVALLPVLSI